MAVYPPAGPRDRKGTEAELFRGTSLRQNVRMAEKVRGEINERVRQLRDPALFEEGVRSWLLFAGAGRTGSAWHGSDREFLLMS